MDCRVAETAQVATGDLFSAILILNLLFTEIEKASEQMRWVLRLTDRDIAWTWFILN